MSKSMRKILDILNQCLKLKDHDLFFSFHPHTDLLDITFYRDGWEPNTDYSLKFEVRPSDNSVKRYGLIDDDNVWGTPTNLEYIELFLTELKGENSDRING